MSLNEFDIITTYFKKKAVSRNDVVLGIGDDCAILQPPAGKNLLVSTDTLNVNRHFLPDTYPFDIGYKAVAVSLSDIAAMGGEPAWMLLSLTLPTADSSWLEAFSMGLFCCLEQYGVTLVGGNITKGSLAVTTQIIGFSRPTNQMTRASAKPGDLIYVTDTLGDAALALSILKKKISADLFTAEEIAILLHKLQRPTARISEGQQLQEIAHAAIDISDGLIADLTHILNESNVGAILYLEQIPTSSCLAKLASSQRYQLALSGGDDYELCFTAPAGCQSVLEKLQQKTGCMITCIGQITQEQGLSIKTPNGALFQPQKFGYEHFSSYGS